MMFLFNAILSLTAMVGLGNAKVVYSSFDEAKEVSMTEHERGTNIFDLTENEKFGWDIQEIDFLETRNNSTSNSSSSETQHFVASYNISRREYSVGVFQSDCKTPIQPESTMTTWTSFLGTSKSHGILQVHMEFVELRYRTSNIWNTSHPSTQESPPSSSTNNNDMVEGYLNFCIRLDLLLVPLVPNDSFVDTTHPQNYESHNDNDLKIDNSTTTSMISNTAKKLISINFLETQISVPIYQKPVDDMLSTNHISDKNIITACQCSVTRDCINNNKVIQSVDEDIYLCIKVNIDGIIVLGIKSLQFVYEVNIPEQEEHHRQQNDRNHEDPKNAPLNNHTSTTTTTMDNNKNETTTTIMYRQAPMFDTQPDPYSIHWEPNNTAFIVTQLGSSWSSSMATGEIVAEGVALVAFSQYYDDNDDEQQQHEEEDRGQRMRNLRSSTKLLSFDSRSRTASSFNRKDHHHNHHHRSGSFMNHDEQRTVSRSTTFGKNGPPNFYVNLQVNLNKEPTYPNSFIWWYWLLPVIIGSLAGLWVAHLIRFREVQKERERDANM